MHGKPAFLRCASGLGSERSPARRMQIFNYICIYIYVFIDINLYKGINIHTRARDRHAKSNAECALWPGVLPAPLPASAQEPSHC